MHQKGPLKTATQSEETPVVPGDVLLGKYRVERVLGQGGMGVVVSARHIELGELYAIKFLSTKAFGIPDAVKRFLREARASARLKSEHVATVHDVGNLETGMPYMVMEYLAGHDLKAQLRQHGRFPLQEAVTLVLQACDAIAEAHTLGIIHRDLKPSNLFLTKRRDGTPCLKVLDFGIAKEISAEGADLTKSGAMLGSPLYMSPEQMTRSKSVDMRTDIWSIGVVLYELLTGKTPFRGETLTEIVGQVLQNKPTPPSQLVTGLPSWMDDVVARCLEKHPENRFLTIDDFAAALRAGGDPKRAVLHAPKAADAGAVHDDLAVASTKKEGAPSSDLATASTAEVETPPAAGAAAATKANDPPATRKAHVGAQDSGAGSVAAITLESAPPGAEPAATLPSKEPASTTLAESTWGRTGSEPRTSRMPSRPRLVAGAILLVAALGVAAGLGLVRSASPESRIAGEEAPATVTEAAMPAPSASALADPSTRPVEPSTAGSSSADPIAAASSSAAPMTAVPAGTRTKKSQGAPGGAGQATKREPGTSPQAPTAAQNSLEPKPAATTAAPSSSSKPKPGYEGVF